MKNTISILYIARGKDVNSFYSFKNFAKTYAQYQAGINHNLYIIFKGFKNNKHIQQAKSYFKNLNYKSLYLNDDAYDIGAYIDATKKIDSKFICCLKTSSVILSRDWLLKLYINLNNPSVGLVGTTGSFESLYNYKNNFPPFPNPHIRSTAFMIKSKYFLRLSSRIQVKTKDDAWFFESGPYSLTNMIYADGKECLVVGKNGRGYVKNFWSKSHTYRIGLQENLLVGDNVTDFYMKSSSIYKKSLTYVTWR